MRARVLAICTRASKIRSSLEKFGMAQKAKEIVAQDPSAEGGTALPSAQPPVEAAAPETKPISKVAGGVTAALEAAKFAFREMGVVRGTRTLLQLNQKDGLDCPGCAWP